MLAAWYRNQMAKRAYEESRALGFIVGRAEERGAWRYWRKLMERWELRRLEAERLGKTFTEPPPPQPDELYELPHPAKDNRR